MQQQKSGGIVIYGINPIKELFSSLERNGKKRDVALITIFLTKETREKKYVMSLLQKMGALTEIRTYAEIEHMSGKGTVHQGMAALVPKSLLYSSFEEALLIEKKKEKSLIVLLDELEDPHNVGAIIRSAASFGASLILLPLHGQVELTGAVIKTASGLNFTTTIAKIGNVNTVLEKLKDEHFWIYGLAGEGKDNLPTISFDNKTVLVIGGEGKGIREKTREACDYVVRIPIDEKCESLNASVAASIALYEWKRQQE